MGGGAGMRDVFLYSVGVLIGLGIYAVIKMIIDWIDSKTRIY
jgi:hypothetical protein